MPETNQTTPPHRPTYNVRLTNSHIRSITKLVFPDHEFISSEVLESGKAYNNRIYFIKTRQAASSLDDANSAENSVNEVALKLSGHYFKDTKVQNEIGALLLLQKYCPDIPVPRLLAWSEDGKVIQTTRGETFDAGEEALATSKAPNGWILSKRLPGRILRDSDLKGPHCDSILKEVAGHLATWRTSIPSPGCIGNLRFLQASDPPSPASTFDLFESHRTSHPLPKFTPGGMLLWHRYNPAPIPTAQAYYTYQIEDQLFRLWREAHFETLRARIEGQVQRLVENMSRFSFCNSSARHPDSIKFTQMDLAPRNILISDSADGPPHVTGIVDFEFSAFLPYEDEFINSAVRQAEDWTQSQWNVLMTELARLGCEVPHLPNQLDEPACTKKAKGVCTCDSGAFEGLSILAKVIENIAPWYVQEGSHGPIELAKEVDKASEAVLNGIKELDRFST